MYRRRRQRLLSYQEYLASGGMTEAEVGGVIGAETAAFQPGGAGRAVLIGVVTGVLTMTINRWLQEVFK